MSRQAQLGPGAVRDGRPSARAVADLRAELEKTYAGEPFVNVLPEGGIPHTRHVKGSNQCLISVFPDRIPGRAIVLSGESHVGRKTPRRSFAATGGSN